MSKQTQASSSQPKKPAPNSKSGNIVGLFWDFENCALPRGANAFDVVKNIRKLLVIGAQGREDCFLAIGDSSKMPQVHQQGLAHANVKMQHVPGGKEGAADRALWVELDRFVYLNPAPASIVIITGDIDFVQKISLLRHTQGYRVTVIHNQVAKRELKETANSVYEWSMFTRTPQKEAPVQKPSSGSSANHSNQSQTSASSSSKPQPSKSKPPKSQSSKPAKLKLVCMCASEFSTYDALAQHQHAKSHWSCWFCDRKPFGSEEAVHSHMLQKHKDQCQEESSSSSDDSDSDGRDYHCPVCDDYFGSETALFQHREAKQHWFVCNHCRAEFTTKQGCEAHQRDKHGGNASLPNHARNPPNNHTFTNQSFPSSSSSTVFETTNSPFGGIPFQRVVQEVMLQEQQQHMQQAINNVPSIANGQLQMGEPIHNTSPQEVELARAQENRLKREHDSLLSPDAASSSVGGKPLLWACPQCSVLCEGTGSLQRHYHHMHAKAVEAQGQAFSKWHQQKLTETTALVEKRIQCEADRQLAAQLSGVSVKREIIPFNATMPPPEIRGVGSMKYVLYCTIKGCPYPRSLGAAGYAEHYSIYHAADAPAAHRVNSQQ